MSQDQQPRGPRGAVGEARVVPSLQVLPEAARALVGGSLVDSGDRRCPVCQKPLRPRQRACSGRCRAEISRQRKDQARQARERQIQTLLRAALDLMGQDQARES
jgi:predicted nucleic acid-binding Zn ribbon protein